MFVFGLIIFDMDGVLVNTSPCHGRAYDDLWRKLGIEGPPYDEIAGRRTGEVVVERTRNLKPAAAQVSEWVLFKQKRAREYLCTEDISYADTAPCLVALESRGVPAALGTSASRANTELILDRLGLARFFRVVVTGEDVREGKPSPEIYLSVMERAGMSANETLVVEDSASGLEAAIAAGARAASVRTGERIDSPKFIGAFPDLRRLMNELGIET
ncbi:MAG: HAD family hydrolase [Pyrinomonadaceae bacterium]